MTVANPSTVPSTTSSAISPEEAPGAAKSSKSTSLTSTAKESASMTTSSSQSTAQVGQAAATKVVALIDVEEGLDSVEDLIAAGKVQRFAAGTVEDVEAAFWEIKRNQDRYSHVVF